MARFANDPRNQEGFGKNIGDKLKDQAQSAWDTAKNQGMSGGYDQKSDYNLNKGRQ